MKTKKLNYQAGEKRLTFNGRQVTVTSTEVGLAGWAAVTYEDDTWLVNPTGLAQGLPKADDVL
jgi:hypothetical protein